MSLLKCYVLIILVSVESKVIRQINGIFIPKETALSFQNFSNCLFMGIKFKQTGSCFSQIGIRSDAVG
jgi:hypothetical protein